MVYPPSLREQPQNPKFSRAGAKPASTARGGTEMTPQISNMKNVGVADEMAANARAALKNGE